MTNNYFSLVIIGFFLKVFYCSGKMKNINIIYRGYILLNKSEVSEIKKQYGIKDCGLGRVVGRYVGPEGDVRASFNKTFLMKEEEEQHKYLSMFKKSLSGGIGKTLNTFEINDTQRRNNLSGLVSTGLVEGSQGVIDAFFDMVSDEINDHSEFVGGYLMALVSNDYDIPNRNDDGLKDGESTEVYSYIHFILCPVSSEKAGLMYDGNNEIIKKELRQVVEDPVLGFIYPSFEDRTSDDEKVTVYVKKGDSFFDGVITGVLGCEVTPSYSEQRSMCEELIARMAEEKETGAEKIEAIKSVVQDFVNRSDEGLKSFIKKDEVKAVLEKQGATEDMVDDVVGDLEEMSVAAVCVPDVSVSGEGYSLKVSAERAHLFTRKEINGKEYLMIEVPAGETVTVNGIEG